MNIKITKKLLILIIILMGIMLIGGTNKVFAAEAETALDDIIINKLNVKKTFKMNLINNNTCVQEVKKIKIYYDTNQANAKSDNYTKNAAYKECNTKEKNKTYTTDEGLNVTYDKQGNFIVELKKIDYSTHFRIVITVNTTTVYEGAGIRSKNSLYNIDILYREAKPKVYVTIDNNKQELSVDNNGDVTLPEMPKKDGYEFVCWQYKINGSFARTEYIYSTQELKGYTKLDENNGVTLGKNSNTFEFIAKFKKIEKATEEKKEESTTTKPSTTSTQKSLKLSDIKVGDKIKFLNTSKYSDNGWNIYETAEKAKGGSKNAVGILYEGDKAEVLEKTSGTIIKIKVAEVVSASKLKVGDTYYLNYATSAEPNFELVEAKNDKDDKDCSESKVPDNLVDRNPASSTSSSALMGLLLEVTKTTIKTGLTLGQKLFNIINQNKPVEQAPQIETGTIFKVIKGVNTILGGEQKGYAQNTTSVLTGGLKLVGTGINTLLSSKK